MPRPRKRHRLGYKPRPAIYKPAGVPLNDLHQVILQPDELEALRLADLRGLTQAQAASAMRISVSTLQRIVARARRQVILALVEGSALILTDSIMDVKGGVLRRRWSIELRMCNLG